MASSEVAFRRASSSGSTSNSSTSGSDAGKTRVRSAVVEVPKNAPRPPPPNLSPQSSPPPLESRDRRRPRHTPSTSPERSPSPPPKKKKPEPDPLLTRTGGAYIPPARLRMMQESITDKSSVAYQRIAWEALKKSINGLVNKVNVTNIRNIISELFQENVVRGRGLMTRSVIQAQSASPMFTHVYAGLVAIINTKFPQTGELLSKRLIVRFRRAFRRNDKAVCIATVKFLAHLVNQLILHELVALELLTLLLEEPTDDSVEVAVGFIKECGMKLKELAPKGLHAVFETFRSILQSGRVSSRVEYMIEVLHAIRKDNFKDHPAVLEELDLVGEEDQITHLLSLADESYETEDVLNVFRPDPDYQENEEKYKLIRAEILGDGVGSGSSESEDASEDSEESGEEEEGDENKMDISDQTGSKEKSVRRQIYLTIMSSLDFEECAHKLMKTMGEGHETEIALMLVECCSQERSYLRFYGLLGQRLCLLNQAWVAVFNEAFENQYETVHRLETNKLRNVAKFFGQLFYVDALPWTSMSCIHLNEEETNSSSRIFIKILFQELAEFMGLPKLNEKLRDPMLAPAYEGLMPRDNPKNTRFAINFFTSIGLGGLTDDLREHLKNAQKLIMSQKQEVSSTDSSSSSESEEGSSDESSSEDSEEERKRRKHRSGRHSSKRENGSERKSRSLVKRSTGRRDRSGSSEREQRKRGRSSSGHRAKDDRKKGRPNSGEKRRDRSNSEEKKNRSRKRDRSRSEERRGIRKRDRSGSEERRGTRKRDRSGSEERRKRRDRSGSEERRKRRDRSGSEERRKRDRSGSEERRKRDRSGSEERRKRDRSGSEERRETRKRDRSGSEERRGTRKRDRSGSEERRGTRKRDRSGSEERRGTRKRDRSRSEERRGTREDRRASRERKKDRGRHHH